MYKPSNYNIELRTNSDGETLVLNSNTVSAAWLNEEELKYLYMKRTESAPERLIKAGMLIDSKRVEIAEIIKQRHREITEDDQPAVEYIIASTLACNMKCVYCFENCTEQKPTISDEALNKIYSHITEHAKSSKKLRLIHITWFGGEPTLDSKRIIEFSNKLNKFGTGHNIKVKYTMITNGLLLTPDLAEKFRDAGITVFQITLDGMSKTYAKLKRCKEEDFYTVINNIKACEDIVDIGIRINVSKINKDEVAELYDLLYNEENPLKKAQVYLARTVAYKDGQPEEETLTSMEYEKFRREFYESLIYRNTAQMPFIQISRKIVWCNAPTKPSITFGPDGLMYKCESCIGQPELSVGSLEEGYTGSSTDNIFRDLRLPSGCLRCSYLPLCGGGCIYNREIERIPWDCDAIKYGIETDINLAVCSKIYNSTIPLQKRNNLLRMF